MKIYTDLDLQPNIQKFLSKIADTSLFHNRYGLKHPSALYNLSMAKIESSLKDFLEIYKKYDDKNFEEIEKENTPKLIKAYKELLYNFREHLDDCLHVVKSFIPPPSNEKTDRNQYAWLDKNAKSIVEDFFNKIDEYKRYLDSSVNELKHNNAVLCCVAFYDSRHSEHCLGYFVANVVDGGFEPSPKVHTKFNEMHTAFSFRRDLTYNLVNIYNLSEEIISLLKEKIGIDFDAIAFQTIPAVANKREMFMDLMSMPRIHFPDEYLKPVPSLSITGDEKLKLEYPSMLSIKPNRLNRVVVNFATDGHTGKFAVPYMHPKS